GDQVIRLNRENPAVVAVREGKHISLDGRTETATTSPQQKAKRQAIYALLLLSLLPLLGGLWWWSSSTAAVEPETVAAETTEAIALSATNTATATVATVSAVPQTPTAVATSTPLPTFAPVAVDPQEYEVQITNEMPLATNNNPIALQFLGQEYRVTTAELTAAWEPQGIEWWPGTHVRRVLAMPYQEPLLSESFNALGQTILVRLRTGASIAYTLDDIQRVHSLEIQHLTSTTPSLALILYGESSEERWLITGRAVQEETAPSPATDLAATTLDFLTIYSCHHTTYTVSCDIEVTDPAYLNQLILTDLAWLEALDQLPAGDLTPYSTLTAQLSGTVRAHGTAVIVWRADDDTVAVQPLLATVFQPQLTQQGD
ncbi:MAG: hypothetical protein KDE51_21355, partial [Anaerolineales bacterium]|nr:hypothetical protein [Anaerolineales bacterium]